MQKLNSAKDYLKAKLVNTRLKLNEFSIRLTFQGTNREFMSGGFRSAQLYFTPFSKHVILWKEMDPKVQQF